jgi:hypothetical protein
MVKFKSKDGKSGWVNVVTGGTCASDEPGEGAPNVFLLSKRASMSKQREVSSSKKKESRSRTTIKIRCCKANLCIHRFSQKENERKSQSNC